MSENAMAVASLHQGHEYSACPSTFFEQDAVGSSNLVIKLSFGSQRQLRKLASSFISGRLTYDRAKQLEGMSNSRKTSHPGLAAAAAPH